MAFVKMHDSTFDRHFMDRSVSKSHDLELLSTEKAAINISHLWHSPFKAKGEVGCEALSPSLNQQHQKSNMQTATAKAMS